MLHSRNITADLSPEKQRQGFVGLGKGTELKVATVGWQEGCVSGGHPGDKAVVDKSYGSGPGFMDHVTPLWGPQKPSGRG